jgi:hypothetical protein
MIKACLRGILGCLAVSGATAPAFAQAAVVPPYPVLPAPPGYYSADRLPEGRSMYQSIDPSRFPNHVDERGYQSGMPENPQF